MDEYSTVVKRLEFSSGDGHDERSHIGAIERTTKVHEFVHNHTERPDIGFEFVRFPFAYFGGEVIWSTDLGVGHGHSGAEYTRYTKVTEFETIGGG